MARMYSNEEIHRRNYENRSQQNNWILDSCATCHMTPEISDFITGSLVEIYKYIEVADDNIVTAKQIGQVKIEMHDNNSKPFIAALYIM